MAQTTFSELDLEEIDSSDGLERVLAVAKPDGGVEASAEDWFSCVDRVLVCNEPVKITGSAQLPSDWDGAAVIFAKGLEVEGTLEDSGGDDCVVCVLGDLKATRLIASVYWLVTGDVTIASTAIGIGTLDYLMEFDGTGTCDTLIERDYALGFKARIAVKAGVRDDVRGVLVPECLDENGVMNAGPALELVRKGQPIAVKS